MATSGAMRRKPATSPAQVDLTAVGPGRAGLHAGHVGHRDVGFEDLLGDDHPQGGIKLRRAARQHRGLARAGGAGEHDRLARAHGGPQEFGGGGVEHVAVHQVLQAAVGDAGELADVDQEVTVAPDITVDDVQAGPVVELGVLEAFGGVELAVRAGGVVEDLGQGPHDVLVVVEDLVVVAGGPAVALDEDGVGPVDHDLPHVGIVQQGGQRAVAGEVAVGPVGHLVRVSEIDGAQAPAVVGLPAGHLVDHEVTQHLRSTLAGDVEGPVLGPGLDVALDLDQRRHPARSHPRLLLHCGAPPPRPGRQTRSRMHCKSTKLHCIGSI